ncbi:MAG: polyribonucleotide nucleotidyltransferase [Bdellovibrionales bacterium]
MSEFGKGLRKTVEFDFNGKTVSLETGWLAKQADGAVLVRSGGNAVLVTAVSSTRESTMGFFPLTIEFSEKMYAAGRVPGGYFKREGRPTSFTTLNARMIDRPIRPCFPEGYQFETQVVATVMSYDGKFPVEILASIGASAALHISNVPFNGPTCAATVGRIDGKWVANLSEEQMEASDCHFVVAGTEKGLLMVEGEGDFLSEAEALDLLKWTHNEMTPAFKAQDELRALAGNKTKREFIPFTPDATRGAEMAEFVKPLIADALSKTDKMERYQGFDDAKAAAKAKFVETVEDKDLQALVLKELSHVVDNTKYTLARAGVLDTGSRIDGRSTTQVRPIACEVELFPRVHGSALFTRGETQVIGAVTLGTNDDEQTIETLSGAVKKRFMLHYNFPPFCVGETGRMGGTSRREIGHGFLAEKALEAVLPSKEDFPYTIRIVNEVLESNGSSSMGSVCSGTMALLDAGVPIKGNVAGIAMGLIKEGDKFAVLTDILGDEDHLGDMDFKVAGTKEGISALQMDIKIDSIGFDIMEQALTQAKDGRLHILGEMEKAISVPRNSISEFAPRIHTIKVKPEKVREVIGPGGKMIKSIVEETGVKIDINDDGTINVASTDPTKSARAIEIIEGICAEAEVGKTYSGKVVKIMDFGALVEVLPGTAGLLHISEMAHERVRNVTDVVNEGDQIDVKVLDVDRAGRIKLSRKAILAQEAH